MVKYVVGLLRIIRNEQNQSQRAKSEREMMLKEYKKVRSGIIRTQKRVFSASHSGGGEINSILFASICPPLTTLFVWSIGARIVEES